VLEYPAMTKYYFDHTWPRRFRLPPRCVDIGVVATPDTMFGMPRLEGHRLTMRHLKRLSRQDMHSLYQLTDAEIDVVIRYWEVRGFTKVR
jgi:uncharacterized protein (DUF433 family)